jgi:hypothetical protein
MRSLNDIVELRTAGSLVHDRQAALNFIEFHGSSRRAARRFPLLVAVVTHHLLSIARPVARQRPCMDALAILN